MTIILSTYIEGGNGHNGSKIKEKLNIKKMVFLQQKPIKICVLKQLSNDKRNTKTKKLINVRDMIHNDK